MSRGHVAGTNPVVCTMRNLVAGTKFCSRNMSHGFKMIWIHATCCGDKSMSRDLSPGVFSTGEMSPRFVGASGFGVAFLATGLGWVLKCISFWHSNLPYFKKFQQSYQVSVSAKYFVSRLFTLSWIFFQDIKIFFICVCKFFTTRHSVKWLNVIFSSRTCITFA